ncbi:MAG: hypothetical protein ACRDQW_18320, partial [Haloechinothrix sp.]
GELLADHRLRRELIATIVANDLVNRMGATFVFRLARETGDGLVDVARAYWAAREVAGADRWWRRIEDVGDVVGPDRQLELKARIDGLVANLARAYLDEVVVGEVGDLIARDRPVFERLLATMDDIGTPAQCRAREERVQLLLDDLIDPDLALLLVVCKQLTMIPDVTGVAASVPGDRAPAAIADTFLRLAAALGLERIEELLGRIEPHDRWPRAEHAGLTADLRRLRELAAVGAFTESPEAGEQEAVAAFLARREPRVRHVGNLTREAEQADEIRLDAIGVAVRAARDAIES